MKWSRRDARPRALPLQAGLRRVCRAFEPWLLLATRLWLAQAFLTLQATMLTRGVGLKAALSGSFWEQGFHTIASSGVGGVTQALCPILLAVGLATRPAAVAMIVQVALLRHPGERQSLDVLWAALLVALAIFGAGAISLDRWLGPGVANSALPGMRRIAAFYGRLRRFAAPILLLVLRLAGGLVVLDPHLAPSSIGAASARMAGLHLPGTMRMLMASLPTTPGMIGALPASLAAAAALLLAAGFAVRPMAVLLLLLAPLGGAASVADERLYWLLLLGYLAVEGGGRLGLDGWIAARFDADTAAIESLPHVVVVGGGFAGHAAVRGLAKAPCRITLIDRHNYFLFQPLLYQVATAGLSPADIATPIRTIFREQRNARVVLGEVTGVDVDARAVRLGETRISYDMLVLATGAQHAYFGRDEWGAFAPGLKTIEDATSIRRRLLVAFEAAEQAVDAEARRAWLTFVVVGGGPTGVELAGAIAELARFGMTGEFSAIDPSEAQVVLVQSAPRLLPSFPESLSVAAHAALDRLGVDVRLDSKADAIDHLGVTVGGAKIASRTILWAAGVAASPAARWLGAPADRAGRVEVGPDLRVPGCGEVFAIGDTCAANAWNGRPVPGLAPAAKQAGAHAAKVISAALRGRAAPPSFAYRHLGSLATIGRKAAVADFGRLRFRGAFAWWLWGAVHILFLIGGRNRAGVVLEWLWDYFTLRRGTRLIVGPEPAPSLSSPPDGVAKPALAT